MSHRQHDDCQRRLLQVQAVLGRADAPCLPPNAVDLAFMRQVYHHFTKPREMLFHGKTLLAKLHERLAPDARF